MQQMLTKKMIFIESLKTYKQIMASFFVILIHIHKVQASTMLIVVVFQIPGKVPLFLSLKANNYTPPPPSTCHPWITFHISVEENLVINVGLKP